MKWKGRRQSGNVEDRRGKSSRGKAVTGGGIVVVLIVLALNFFGGETGQQLAPIVEQLGNSQTTQQTEQRALTPQEKEMGDFMATVLGDTEDVWTQVFRENNLGEYKYPKMVLFTNDVTTGCGNATAATGPFYCPADQKLYMDLGFFDELKNRFGAKGGDFAITYVMAHEIGHHIQNLVGISKQVRKVQQGMSKAEANEVSVAVELQADFYAGVFTYYNQKYLEAGDIEEALSAANAVGDDAIQKRIQGRVVPDSFTHGTSKQRKEWFMKGYTSGDIKQGDTFSVLLK